MVKVNARELNPFGYTGAYQLQDGTVHLSHRFMDTFTLGFTQPDPSRQELNNHTCAGCDPINNTDPTGLNTCAWGIAGMFATMAGFAWTASSVASLGAPVALATDAAGPWGLAIVGLVAIAAIGVGGSIDDMQSC
ncbi:RHS repeat-associated core domain-containing protein [Nocardiopsis sp. MG754419]|uniref:RHS repeat-associated core domain-containing protein n=1 Tax=Nocardiopsis sp. MG754419 TaxID=2259865 RepID=UPI001BA999E3|nr:RHS repeat-associated core domain-containing protein [Nocardiopsis sp. MG754419]MBR8741660.1 hypothetical protein [Nocardiopsis sp. MG754419]